MAGARICSTVEPCLLRFTAIHWARTQRIVYRASVEDAKSFGTYELLVFNDLMKTVGVTGVEITPHFVRGETLALFRDRQGRRLTAGRFGSAGGKLRGWMR